MEWHVGQDNPILEQQGRLQLEGPLIMEETLPPVSRENFWNYDGDPGVRLLVQELLDVVENGPHDGSVGRGQDDEVEAASPLRPLHFESGRGARIYVD